MNKYLYLELRRLRADLLMFFKIVHNYGDIGQIYLNLTESFSLLEMLQTRGNSLKLLVLISGDMTFCRDWNE